MKADYPSRNLDGFFVFLLRGSGEVTCYKRYVKVFIIFIGSARVSCGLEPSWRDFF